MRPWPPSPMPTGPRLGRPAGGLVELVDPARFPDAARLFVADIWETPPEDPDADLAFGLELVLDGVAAAVDQTRAKN